MSRRYFEDMFNDPASRQGRRLMLFVNSLIVLSMVAYSLSTVSHIAEVMAAELFAIEVFIVIIFTLEYGCRVYFSPNRRRFIFSFFGIVDFLSFAPLYLFLFTGVDARALRAARMFRLLRLFKLFRFAKSTARLRAAYGIIKDELVLFGAVSSILLFVSGVGIYHFESEAQPEAFSSVFDGLWWAVVTLTTVGYGDVVPVTAGGKFFTFFIVIIGLGIVAVPTGLIVSGVQEARKDIE
ncbi:ion transporter [Aliikangiella coralliicola]|uniref:Ion transporter n=1 Tax=Aliikangiella coralliicola TaxID=2592383 RepID=A0A545UDM1_9GAMM|nr:ion transporter [Aliikangiella coralliicola]TQV87558.1 ion transporter [Aliikangiella coralliicola]